MAAIDYYNDSSQHGSYQYITLEQIVNNYMMALTDNSYNFNASRHQVLYQARRGFREFYYDILREIKAIELELSPALILTLPPDFVSYVRISWVDDSGQLHPMSVDNKVSIAKEYLQAHDYSLLFDDDGCVLIGNNDVKSNGDSSASNTSNSYSQYSICSSGFSPNVNAGNIFKNGKYRLNKRRGVIEFGSGVEGKNIVLEYISDGLYTGCEGVAETEISIHKFAESAIIAFIHYEMVKGTTVPQMEQHRARKEYYNLRRIAKMRLNPLRKEELLQALKGGSKWIK